MKTIHPLLARILPILMIIFVIVLFVIGIFIFSYVLLIGLIIGLVLFAFGFIRAKFFGSTTHTSLHEEMIIDIKREQTKKTAENKGRLIEHDDEEHK